MANQAGEVLIELFDYDANGNVIYSGACSFINGSTGEDIWYLYKFSYDSNDNVIRKEVRQLVAWDDRALLDWL